MSDPSAGDARPAAALRALVALSDGLLRVERAAIAGLMCLVTGLILLNVVTRYGGIPLYWVDESAVYAVVWLTFVGASAMTRLRLDFKVTILTERLPPRLVWLSRAAATAMLFVFGVALAAMCWLWMDPVGIASAGFDARDFAAETFNFLYTERTQTLNWPTWVVNLVIPLFAVSLTVHGAANLAEDLDLVPRTAHPGFADGTAEGVS